MDLERCVIQREMDLGCIYTIPGSFQDVLPHQCGRILDGRLVPTGGQVEAESEGQNNTLDLYKIVKDGVIGWCACSSRLRTNRERLLSALLRFVQEPVEGGKHEVRHDRFAFIGAH